MAPTEQVESALAEDHTDDSQPEERLLDDDMETEETAPRRSRLIVVEPVLALYFMSTVPGLTLSQQFVYSQFAGFNNLSSYSPELQNGSSACESATENDSYSRVQGLVQAESAQFNLYLDVSSVVVSFFVVFLYGSLSDAYGRRLTMLLPICGNILNYIIYVIVITQHYDLYYLLIGNIIEGLLGGPATLVTACFAFIADTTDLQQRTFRLTINEVVFNLANAVAQAVFGYLIRALGYLYPIYVLMALQCINLFYVALFVPDAIQRPGAITLTQLLTQIKNRMKSCVALYLVPDQFGQRWSLPICSVAVFFSCLVFVPRFAPTILFELNAPLCWDSVQIGAFGALGAILSNVGSLSFVRFGRRRFGETGLAIIGSVSSVLGFVVMAFALKSWIMYLSPVVGLAGYLPLPMLRATMSKRTSKDNQGALFAGISALDALCALAGTLVFIPIYEATLTFWKGFVFLAMAIVNTVALAFVVVAHVYVRRIRGKERTLLTNDVDTFVE